MLGIECQICQISLQFGAQWKRFDFFCHCPTMFKSHSASSNQPTTTGWHWAGPSGKPAARTICFRFLAKPRCAVKCIPFTQPAFSLLKLLVLQVKLSFPNSGGAIILMEQGFKKRGKKEEGKKKEKKRTEKRPPQHSPLFKYLLSKLSVTLFVNLIAMFAGFIILKDVLLRTIFSKGRMCTSVHRL